MRKIINLRSRTDNGSISPSRNFYTEWTRQNRRSLRLWSFEADLLESATGWTVAAADNADDGDGADVSIPKAHAHDGRAH